MPKKLNLCVDRIAQLVVRHTYNTIVNEFETAGPGQNALILSFIDFIFYFDNITIVLVLCCHSYQLTVKVQTVISSL
jgi:hypothetical protein